MHVTDVSAELIREALRAQHPDLADLPLREVEGGWGNQMWRLGSELAVRVQRMNVSAAGQFVERQWSPQLASRLPLPIPVPVRNGAPSSRFPKIWTVMTWVDGSPADRSAVTHGADAADALAGFLRALHTRAPADAPRDTAGRAAHPRRCTSAFEHLLASVDPAALGDDASRVRQIWDDASAAAAWDAPMVWVHGDLHPANVVTIEGTISGVLDFEDLLGGDPAADIAAAWLLLPADAISRFFASYARADDATVARARGHAVLKSLFLMLMGQNGVRGVPGGKPAWGPIGRTALDRILQTT